MITSAFSLEVLILLHSAQAQMLYTRKVAGLEPCIAHNATDGNSSLNRIAEDPL